jgi:myo-inositol 2-dehydrogenase / D-chiro-inositol 1-dehydrogenase
MGRDSAYTGKEVSWEKALNSQRNTFPKTLAWGPMDEPAVPMPGVTELI